MKDATTTDTSTLSGAALDYAVAKIERDDSEVHGGMVWIGTKRPFSPSTSWADAGPLIEREKITLAPEPNRGGWSAGIVAAKTGEFAFLGYADTPLEAAMRCFVRNRVGDIYSVPAEITNPVRAPRP